MQTKSFLIIWLLSVNFEKLSSINRPLEMRKVTLSLSWSANCCLFSEPSSASTRGRHIRAAAAAHPLFEVSMCNYRMSQFARCFLTTQVRMCMEWSSSHCVCHRNVGWVLYCAVNRWLLPKVVFFSFPWHMSLWGCESNF